MTAALLLAFIGFAFVSSITPGPNNTMLLASGVNYGFRRTLPHIAGISLGCMVMLLLVGLGLGQVFAALPQLYGVLRYAGAAYLLWLAWKIATAGAMTAHESEGGRPLDVLAGGGVPVGEPESLDTGRGRCEHLCAARGLRAQRDRARHTARPCQRPKHLRLGWLWHGSGAVPIASEAGPRFQCHHGAVAGSVAAAHAGRLTLPWRMR